MTRKPKTTATILAQHRVDDTTRRYAVQVKEGRVIIRVVVLDVTTTEYMKAATPSGFISIDFGRMNEAAKERAMFHSILVKGTKWITSVYDDRIRTGLGEPV